MAYIAAGVVAIYLASILSHWHPVWVVAAADLAGTLVIFGFSVFYTNASFYDPYWSVAPILIGVYWMVSTTPLAGDHWRQAAVMGLLLVWALRLTLNWGVRWKGIQHEDWRYRDIRKRHPKYFLLISFFGIHLMPTILVFFGCLCLFPVFSGSPKVLNGLDLVAFLVTGTAIWIEARADFEITRFMRFRDSSSQLVRSGVWAWSRHPNYLGEILFWWGMFIFALAADPRYWWVAIGPGSITLLFIKISIPMIENRMLERKPDYASYKGSTPVLFPGLWKKEHQTRRMKK